MKHKHLLLILILISLSLSWLSAQSEQSSSDKTDIYMKMAYNIFDKLYANDASVVYDIDWNVLIIDYDSVYVKFKALSTNTEKQEFQAKTISSLSYYLQIYEDEGDYYEWEFKQTDDTMCYLYGMTEYFDVYLDFRISNGKLVLTNVSFEDYY